jgi:hypothetical protein
MKLSKNRIKSFLEKLCYLTNMMNYNKGSGIMRGLFAESWNVAYRIKQNGLLLSDIDTTFKVIKNSYCYWAADPFIINYNGETYIFAELYDYIHRKGIIGYTKFENGSFKKWYPIIREDYHLSFPFIFQYDGEIYIMPESSSNNSLYLYKATDFPSVWEKQDNLLDNIKIVDTVPFRYNGNLYAFTLRLNNEDNNTMHIIKFDDFGAIFEEKSISRDDSVTRMAGKVIKNVSTMIRVSQNCEYDYGTGIVFSEFHFDEDNNYKEKVLKNISYRDVMLDRKMFVNGLHTYNFNDDFEVIDIKTKRFNIINLVSRIIGKIDRYSYSKRKV